MAELLATHVPLLREPRHRGGVAGDPRQRRVLRGHQGGAQRAAGREDVPWDAAHAEGLPREGARERAAARGRVGLRHHPRPPARGDAQLHRRRRRSTGPTRSGSGAATSTSPTREPRRLGVLPSVRRAPRRVGVDDGPVHPRVARHGQRRHRAAVHRPAVGEEPRAPRPVRARDLQAVRDRHDASDRVPGEPVRPVEGPGGRDRGVPDRARGGAGRAARARGLDGDRRPRGLPGVGAGRGGPRSATATSTCSRTSSRSATCRSTRSSAPRTS